MTIKVFEAFSGVGSQRMALRNIGLRHKVVAISEIDKYALKSYEAIHGDCPNIGDISKLNIVDIPDHDLFTYSFPCQDISVAGSQRGLDEGAETRSSLLWECRRVIEGKSPKYLLMENVKNLIGKKHKHNFDKWLEYLESLGYTNYWEVLNAKDYGIPQNRERVFVVSILGEHNEYTFPPKMILNKRVKDILEIEVEDKYYLSEKIQERFKPNKSFYNMVGNIVGTTAPDFRTIGQRDVCYQENSIMGSLVATDYKQPKQILVKQATKKGYIEMDVPGVCDLSYPDSKTRRGRVQEGRNVSPTLTATQQDICHVDAEYRVRKLTPKECWRLMGFSDEDFEKAATAGVSNAQLYKQAGNSIVVPVLEGIFRQMSME